MENRKLLNARQIKKIPGCAKMTRDFIDYLRVDRKVVNGTLVKWGTRNIYRFTPEEAALIQSVWYFRQLGYDYKNSIERANKAQERREEKKYEYNLFSNVEPA